MKPSFWQRCWQKNDLGFHQNEFNPLLTELFSEFAGDTEGTILVPLCGKSLDMVYLSQTHDVVGCEMNEIACEDFFTEKGLNPRRTQGQYYSRWRNANITLWSGDIFKLQRYDLPNTHLVYDRAALVALPEEMREDYVKHIRGMFREGDKMLLLTVEYPQAEMQGPPFVVDEDEVRRLFKGCDVVRKKAVDIENKQFGERTFDVSNLTEVAYFITFD
jgi:thiopurine S-methyltransferase